MTIPLHSEAEVREIPNFALKLNDGPAHGPSNRHRELAREAILPVPWRTAMWVKACTAVFPALYCSIPTAEPEYSGLRTHSTPVSRLCLYYSRTTRHVDFEGVDGTEFAPADFLRRAIRLRPYSIPLISASLMTTPLIINHLQISKTLIGNGLETSCLRRSALFQYVKYLMQR